jgi:hypothetical protein
MEVSRVCVAVVWSAGAAAAVLPGLKAGGIFSVAFVGEDNLMTSASEDAQARPVIGERAAAMRPLSNFRKTFLEKAVCQIGAS